MTVLITNEHLREDGSLDPYAGTEAPNGKMIWTPEEAGENLNRSGLNWLDGHNYGVADDGVINYGFWDLGSLLTSYYVNAAGTIAFNEAYYWQDFQAFSEIQKTVARDAMGMWDDLVAVSFVESAIANADVTFGNTDDGPFTGAYAYQPYGDRIDAFYKAAYGFANAGRLGGDVWINTQETANFQNFAKGHYANFTLIHEIGHALGFSHAGQYNATNPDGTANPADYAGDAYFYQDSHQYTIMSYFGAEETSGMWIDFRTLTYGYAGTPMVHDIVAAQQTYGADMTTRTGDTVYGFNSNADRDAFHIDGENTFLPLFTIWDAGGNDTLDLSGFDTPSIIDINAGAYSSAGGTVKMDYTLDEVNAARAAVGRNPASQGTFDFYANYAAQYGITDGLLKNNIGIAYNVDVENAIGGSGNDVIKGNALGNVIKGNAGNDVISGGDGLDIISLGADADVFVAEIGESKINLGGPNKGMMSVDIITDFNGGEGDLIDLSGLGSFNFRGTDANKRSGDLTYKTFDTVNAAEKVLGLDIDGTPGPGTGGPVTVVYGNTNGGAADFAIVLLKTASVSASNFVLDAGASSMAAATMVHSAFVHEADGYLFA